MQVKFQKVNLLPARTWNWMGVNGGAAEFTLQKPAPYPESALKGAAPAGVSVERIENAPDTLPAVPVPEETLRFIRENRNAGVMIRADAGVRQPEPVVLDYRLDESCPSVVDDNLVIAGEGSEVTAVLHYTGGGFHGGMTRLVAEKGATVRLVVMQTLGEESENFTSIGGVAREGGRIEIILAELGGRKAYAGCNVRLEGDGSVFDIGELYLGDGKRSIDLGVLAEQFGKKTVSHIDVHGALLDESQKIFRGTIDFKKGSAGSRGREAENTLLLGRHVRSRTAPLILCAEEDVDGRHAATAGRIDENRMFYLMSRGLSKEQVKKLLIEAEFAPITAKIPVESYQREISALLEEKLQFEK